MSNIATLKFQSPQFDMVYVEFLCLISCSCGFPPGSLALSTCKTNGLVRLIDYSNLPLHLNACFAIEQFVLPF